MTVSLTPEKIQRIKEECEKMLELTELPIWEIASLIGLLVSSFPGVLYGPLFYRHLEIDKTTALRQNKGNYNAHMRLSQENVSEIKWWYDSIPTAHYPILLPNSKVDVIIYTDASNKGWGAVKDAEKTRGRWSDEEAKYHINCSELMASFFGLKAFCKNEHGIHVQLYPDNSTTVNYINAMGGTHSRECNTIAKDIWQWCIDKQIWLTAAHIPGTKNVEADRESRVFSDNKEWMIRPDIFQKITDIWGDPSIDLFFNCQISSENTDRFCRRLHDSPNVANSKLVPQTPSHFSGCSKSTTVTTDCLTNVGDETRSSSLSQETGFDYLQIVRQSYETQGFSQKTTSIILQSLRKGTTKQYPSYIKRWTTYCRQKQIDPVSATVPQALDFLVELFETGIGYSGINTARSALSSVLKPVNGITFGAQESVKRFLKGGYEQSRQGSKPTVVKFVAYPDNPNICVVTTLKAYLDRTSALRNKQLFVSYSKPFKPVSRDTISRWVKTVMQKSGIDVNLFRPHSTRAAATSKAFLKSVPLEHILSVAGWSSSDTFANFYKKPVINTDSFSTVLLQD
ncbi:uncharacterized protein [Montipora capricornis]|uniref:uncharacterized protein n=1 Tax=Montipora capricornis TaxID=246305 RepID=UPI0035F17F10